MGSRASQRIPPLRLPNADQAVRAASHSRNQEHLTGAVDILLVNPPAPDGAIWIRSQHRVGRRSREGMVWPQVSLAQLAALFPDYRVEVVDAIAARMSWQEFESLLRDRRPRYYVTQLTAPTLQNDMYGVFLAKSLGAVTITFGTHVTPLPRGTMEPYPALDYALRGEPELTLRELVDTLDWADQNPRPAETQSPWSRLEPSFAQRLQRLFTATDPEWRPAWLASGDQPAREAIKGLVWRKDALHQDDAAIVINADRPLIANLDDLPLPRHELLPLAQYRAPMVRGAYAFVVTSRGCPAGCRFCIKHVSNGNAVRYRSPENVLAEIEQLIALGVRDIHMYADLFTVNREHVVGICDGILQRGWNLRWTCNSRVDFAPVAG